MSAASMAAALLLLAASCAWASAFGQALRDPTEPPPARFAAPAGAAAAPSGPVLQSVIVSDGRKLALIDGKTYRAGDKLGNATVAAISSNEVTLRGSDGTKVLKLYPNLEKTTAGKRAPSGSAGTKGSP